MTDGFALKSWVIDLINKAFKKNGLRYNGIPVELNVDKSLQKIEENLVIPSMSSNSMPFGNATSSSIYNSNYDSCNAFAEKYAGGGRRTGWLPKNNKDGEYVQFNSSSTISFNKIECLYSNTTPPADLSISISNDNESFETIGIIKPKYNDFNILSLDKKYTCKYIRFTMVNSNGSNSGMGYVIKVINSVLKNVTSYSINATTVYTDV